MSGKLIRMEHKVCDYTCMWNGIEDLYQRSTGIELPDLFYLDYYPKFYYKTHIPIHYVLMVGYDDEMQVVYIQDCGMKDVQKLPYSELERALSIEKTTLSDKNTLCCIDFSGRMNDMRQIAIDGFQAKAHRNLNSKVGFVGIKGMRNLAKEIGSWQKQLTEDEYKASLLNIVTFTGTVPMLPARLIGEEMEKNQIKHQALRDRFGELMIELGKRYSFGEWVLAGELFLKSGDLIQDMTDLIVDYLLGDSTGLKGLESIILDIADLEERAYGRILSELND